MSSIALSGNASGAGVLTIAAPNTASNYTLTLPTATTTLVGTDATQTLTNKTLTTPNINSAQVATVSGTAPLYMCRAWVNFDGTKDTTGAVSTANTNRLIRGSGNVTSVLRNSAGNYTVNFTTAMPDANYSAVGSSGYGDSANRPLLVTNYAVNTASGCSVATMNTGNTIGDYSYNSVAIFC